MESPTLSLFTIVLVLMIGKSVEQGVKPWIVHTNLQTLKKLELETWTNSTVVTGLTGAVSVDYHYTEGFLYWSDQLTDRITRMNLSNPDDKEDIATNGMDYADGIAVDWIYNHIYWVDVRYAHVKVSFLNGTLQKTLIRTGLGVPRAIVVDPNKRWLFFTDIYYAKIERCALDGSNRQIIVSNETTQIDDPNGLALDFLSNQLYWIDNVHKQVRACNLDGTGIKMIAESAKYMPWPWGLALYGDWIYWTTYTNNTIYRVDKTTGLNFQVVKSELSYPIGIKVYSQENQPFGNNSCAPNNGGCEQLCFPKEALSIKCACADGFQLKSDEKSCLNIGSGNWLTFADHNGVERLDVATNVTETVIGGLVNAVDLDIHYEKGLVYWSDVLAKKISRTSVTKDSVSRRREDIITETVDTPDGIAIDWMYDLLYWTDTKYDHIQVARLDGKDRKTILKDNSLVEPRAIVVDPTTGWLFFSDWGIRPRIERCRMDGADRRVVVDTNIVWPNGMSIDLIGQRLYWIDGSLNQIKSTRFDGSDTYTIIKDVGVLPKPYDLVVFNNYIYWSNWQYQSICRVNKYTGQDFAIVANYIRKPMGIQMFSAGGQIKDQNVCGQNNGRCSHICFPFPAYNTTKSTLSSCMCPDYYAMQADQKTCLLIEPPTKIVIDVVGSLVTISWTFPVTTDIIRETDLKVYDKDNNLTYSATVYAPTTTHVITTVQLKKCQMYKVKLSCQYSQLGWSKTNDVAFWPTDNRIYATQGTSVNISWTTTTDRSNFDVAFSKLSDNSTSNNIIYSDRILQKDPSKYNGLLKNGLYIQFNLNNAVKEDVGQYKSTDRLDPTLIDGCALLVVTENPLKPELTYDKYPFVGGKTSFACSSQCKRSPAFVPCSLKYVWSLPNSQPASVLEINPVTKADNGKVISCTAVDDKGEVSDSSDTFLIDPYDGPDDVRLSILGDSVNVTKGSKFGPITCTAVCYPICNYKWQRFVNQMTTDVVTGQNLFIDLVSFEDSGTYTCIITHQNDSSRVRTISMRVNVHNSSVQLQTTLPETTVISSQSTPSITTSSTVISSTSTPSLTSSSTVISSSSTETITSPSSALTNTATEDSTVIIYTSIAGGIVVIAIVIVIIIFVCRRLRKTKKPEQNRPLPPNPRDSISTIYDCISDDSNLTTHMQDPDSNYLEPTYETLKSYNTTPKNVYNPLQRSDGTHEMQHIENDRYLRSEVNRGFTSDMGFNQVPIDPSILEDTRFSSGVPLNPKRTNNSQGQTHGDRDIYLSPVQLYH